MEFIKADGDKLRAGGKEILLRGFGLGGWFLTEGYMWQLYTKCDRPRRIEKMIETLCGKEYADSFWSRYLDVFITEDDIRWIAGRGFNCVRLPVNARRLCRMRAGKCEFVAETVSRIDRLIEWCKNNHVYVILDMHAAPGGQTGQNIDDSADDVPRLFMDSDKEEELLLLWRALAARYADEPSVAGYDLLNEPVSKQFARFNDRVLPLYIKLIQAIRDVDKQHAVLLEGVHWATDFSIFDNLKKGEMENAVLQFHKYWNVPDEESLDPYLRYSQKLGMPLLMGEGGENNLEWYTALFPALERKGISWSFWTYKKMENSNSPVSFSKPSGWDALVCWLDGGPEPSRKNAVNTFDSLLFSVSHAKRNEDVLGALLREAPFVLPCEAYDSFQIHTERRSGAELRMHDPVTLYFANGKEGIPDYKRYSGEPVPEEENIVAELFSGESLLYHFQVPDTGTLQASVTYSGEGELMLKADDAGMHCRGDGIFTIDDLSRGRHILTLTCTKGSILADTIRLSV